MGPVLRQVSRRLKAQRNQTKDLPLFKIKERFNRAVHLECGAKSVEPRCSSCYSAPSAAVKLLNTNGDLRIASIFRCIGPPKQTVSSTIQ